MLKITKLLLSGHTRRWILVVIGKTGKSKDNSVIDNRLTIGMKDVSHHTIQLKIVFPDKVMESTKKITK